MEFLFLQYESTVNYKHCQIVKTEAGQFNLSGAKKSFGSLRELLHCYQKEALRSEGYTFQLSRCCPPRLKGQWSHTVQICVEPHTQSYTVTYTHSTCTVDTVDFFVQLIFCMESAFFHHTG